MTLETLDLLIEKLGSKFVYATATVEQTIIKTKKKEFTFRTVELEDKSVEEILEMLGEK